MATSLFCLEVIPSWITEVKCACVTLQPKQEEQIHLNFLCGLNMFSSSVFNFIPTYLLYKSWRPRLNFAVTISKNPNIVKYHKHALFCWRETLPQILHLEQYMHFLQTLIIALGKLVCL